MQTGYFDGKISKGFISLYNSKTLGWIGVGLFGIFLPVFLYELFDKNFVYVAMYYLVGWLIYPLTAVLGAKFLNTFGFKKALQLSSVWGALFYLVFFFVNEANVISIILLSLVFLTMFRLFHWLPFHVDFTKFSDTENRGRQISLMEGTAYAIGAITPIIAGFIIFRVGFSALFLIATFLYLASLIPLLTIPRTQEKFTWGYWETWKRLLSKKHRKTNIAFAADGAEGAIGIVIWPIFIYEILSGNYVAIGAISSAVIGLTIALQMLTGRYVDKQLAKKKILGIGSVFYSLGWIFKIFIATGFQIFVVDIYHRATRVFSQTAFGVLMYDFMSKEGHYVDEYTILRELAINLGRVVVLAVAIVLSLHVSLAWTFVLAAGASMLRTLIESQDATGAAA